MKVEELLEKVDSIVERFSGGVYRSGGTLEEVKEFLLENGITAEEMIDNELFSLANLLKD